MMAMRTVREGKQSPEERGEAHCVFYHLRNEEKSGCLEIMRGARSRSDANRRAKFPSQFRDVQFTGTVSERERYRQIEREREREK